MEAADGLSQQERLQVLAESRKRQTETENKKRQLEQDRRQLQHIKSKALRERWLLEGAPSAGSEEHDAVRKQLEEDENRTHDLENNISRLEDEIMCLESGSTRPYVAMTTQSGKEVKVHSQTPLDQPDLTQPLLDGTLQNSDGTFQNSDGTFQNSEGTLQNSEATLQYLDPPDIPLSSSSPPESLLKAAMYSVEIKVERDNVTGETKVLSTNTLLPVDLSLHGVKVYEDRTKVVHEVNGENDVQPLSFLEVEELIQKADQVSMDTQPAVTPTPTPTHPPADPAPSLEPTPEVQDMAEKIPQKAPKSSQKAPKSSHKAPKSQKASKSSHKAPKSPQKSTQKSVPQAAVEVRGPEQDAELGLAEASEEKPVTMVFMGYQSVEDQDQTSRVLGLEGTVKAELVLIEDNEGNPTPRVSPVPAAPSPEGPPVKAAGPPVQAAGPNGSSPLPSSLPPPKAEERAPGGPEGGQEGGEGEVQNQEKEKKPCKCCVVM